MTMSSSGGKIALQKAFLQSSCCSTRFLPTTLAVPSFFFIIGIEPDVLVWVGGMRSFEER